MSERIWEDCRKSFSIILVIERCDRVLTWAGLKLVTVALGMRKSTTSSRSPVSDAPAEPEATGCDAEFCVGFAEENAGVDWA